MMSGLLPIRREIMLTTSQVVFDPFSADFFNGPYETYRRMREEAPVYYSAEYDFYALTRHVDVAAAFKDFETYVGGHEKLPTGGHENAHSRPIRTAHRRTRKCPPAAMNLPRPT